MKHKEANNDELVDEIQDLTRAVIATSGQFTSKSAAEKALAGGPATNAIK